MSLFGSYSSVELSDAAEKFITKMDESDLAAAIGVTEPTMTVAGRNALVEAIFDAFRGRGESSEDAAEGAGTTLDAIARNDTSAISCLLIYARDNTGLLKEAATTLVEQYPQFITELPPALIDGISLRLAKK
ncbi:MAG: hypothetical protein M3Y21_01345 [Candidatus Eremiobacteraeota bacterium]|nr:hypothetical protein [Candidatus Eremiobacteraeota bacterium]